jgi:pilus assembly protein CpaB
MGGHRDNGRRTLAPLLRDRIADGLRGGGWSRPVVLRRALAIVLVVLAAAIALRPQPGTTTVLVAAHDLTPGTTLGAGDVRPQRLPPELVPSGAMAQLSDVEGRVLAGAARRGEPITDARLLGDGLTRLLAPDSGSASVPVRLSDPDVAALLAPGSTVDVVSVAERGDRPTVLAERATVLAVLDAGDASGPAAVNRRQQGRLVVVVLPRDAATQVAAASLSQSLTVTLR